MLSGVNSGQLLLPSAPTGKSHKGFSQQLDPTCLVECSKRARGSLRVKCRCLGGTNPASDLSMPTSQGTSSEASVGHDGWDADVISRSISEECKWLQPMTRGIYKTLRCLKTPTSPSVPHINSLVWKESIQSVRWGAGMPNSCQVLEPPG